MMSAFSRKNFLLTISGATAGLFIPQLITGQAQNPKPPKGPQLDKQLVQDFVGAAHKDFDKVKTMLEETPDLLNAVHNLGSWDWEDAIGAAGHVGQREMALYLLEKGARPTICVAAMLGKQDIVQSFINSFPAMKDAVGPHKISLLRHAKAGGEISLPVVEYLKGIGVKE